MNEQITREKSHRRRIKILRNMYFLCISFFISQLASFIAKKLGMADISDTSMIFIVLASLLITAIFSILVVIKENISALYVNIVFSCQFILWAVLYVYYIFSLNEIRVLALFFSLVVLLVIITNSNISQSIAVAVGISIIQTAVSYTAIIKFNQPGSINLELFYIGSFLPSAIFACNISRIFKRHRNEINKARKEAETARDSLWGEMELAKKIQTVLLPQRPMISGYDITAFMSPTEDIGGDYYDIINIAGKNWVIIGDVSGHGIPSGLIMMIVQTTIRASLVKHPGMNPSNLLTVINEIISRNIKKFGEDKYMTITVLAVLDDEKFYFSGLHQDIMIYRSAENKVELIETNGIWIGILYDIAGMNADNTFNIEKGDTLLLFTDGITEAFDSDGHMFTQERLCEIFQGVGNKPTMEIKNQILEEFNNYNQVDDITMVIMKRL